MGWPVGKWAKWMRDAVASASALFSGLRCCCCCWLVIVSLPSDSEAGRHCVRVGTVSAVKERIYFGNARLSFIGLSVLARWSDVRNPAEEKIQQQLIASLMVQLIST